ncbi:permease prefix domain 1-containing protein [Paenibacillus sp. JSM ZJ436]|uniref:permease prefix domain 1-containing protein n=1 Tax=Paenibacillus sp. JSM ZJ436 TaxID=3376190 RepID=UPI0037ABBCE2
MNKSKELERFVEQLFAGQRSTPAVEELKYEILTNLEDKVRDYVEQGMSDAEAIAAATRDLDSIEPFLEEDGRQPTNLSSLARDLLQHGLLLLLLACIVTLPARLSYSGSMLHNVLLLLAGILGAGYVVYAILAPRRSAIIVNIPVKLLSTISRWTWLLWGAWLAVVTGFALLLRFGSDLWFGRGLSFSGPYELYALAMELLAPLAAICIPLLVGRARRRVSLYEVSRP